MTHEAAAWIIGYLLPGVGLHFFLHSFYGWQRSTWWEKALATVATIALWPLVLVALILDMLVDWVRSC